MEKLQYTIERIIRILLILLSIAMCTVVFWQVIARFIFSNPSRWSEELARYFMIWIAFLGAALGVLKKSHLGMEIIIDRIRSVRLSGIIRVFIHLLCIVFCIYFVRYGIEYVIEGHKQTAMSFNMRMSYVYAVIPISGVIMIINFIGEILSTMRLIRVGGES